MKSSTAESICSRGRREPMDTRTGMNVGLNVGLNVSQFNLDRLPIPKLADLLADPQRAADLPADAIPVLRGELARLDTVLLSRLLATPNSQAPANPQGDRLLDAQEAAARLGTSADYLYRHSGKLPFTVHLGRRLRFSEAGIERYIRQRTGR